MRNPLPQHLLCAVVVSAAVAAAAPQPDTDGAGAPEQAVERLCRGLVSQMDRAETPEDPKVLELFVDEPEPRSVFLRAATEQRLCGAGDWVSRVTRYRLEEVKGDSGTGDFIWRRVGSVGRPDNPHERETVFRDYRCTFHVRRAGRAWRFVRLSPRLAPEVLEREVMARIASKRERLAKNGLSDDEAASLHCGIAFQYLLIKRGKEAEATARQAVVAKDSYVSRFLLGRALKLQTRYPEAKQQFELARQHAKTGSPLAKTAGRMIEECDRSQRQSGKP